MSLFSSIRGQLLDELEFRGDLREAGGRIPFPSNYNPLMPLPRGHIPTLPSPTYDYPLGGIPTLPDPTYDYPLGGFIPQFPSVTNDLPVPVGATRRVKETTVTATVPDYVKTAPAGYVPPVVNPIISLATTETTNVSHDLVTTVGAPAAALQPQAVATEATVTSADASPLSAITSRFTQRTVQADGTVKTKVDPALLLMAGGIFGGLLLLKAKS